MPELDGQIALVTGGGRGIGANIARELARGGARVAICARSSDQVDDVAMDIGAFPVVANVVRREEVETMVRRIEGELGGPISLLCANAGVGSQEARAWETDPGDWWNVFEVNMLGVYLCCRAVIPGMLRRGGGRIVITGSGAAYLPGTLNSAYAASKAAVWRFGEILAQQLQGQIPVFIFSPGLVRTQMTTWAGDDAVDVAGARAETRAGARLGTGRRARRALHPRRARRHRGSDRAGGRDPRERPERDQATALSLLVFD